MIAGVLIGAGIAIALICFMARHSRALATIIAIEIAVSIGTPKIFKLINLFSSDILLPYLFFQLLLQISFFTALYFAHKLYNGRAFVVAAVLYALNSLYVLAVIAEQVLPNSISWFYENYSRYGVTSNIAMLLIVAIRISGGGGGKYNDDHGPDHRLSNANLDIWQNDNTNVAAGKKET